MAGTTSIPGLGTSVAQKESKEEEEGEEGKIGKKNKETWRWKYRL